MEFKGTKGGWIRVKYPATEYYNERNEIHYGNDGECVAEFVANDYDAKLIASAPDLLNELQRAKETLIQQGFTESSSTIIDINKAIEKALK